MLWRAEYRSLKQSLTPNVCCLATPINEHNGKFRTKIGHVEGRSRRYSGEKKVFYIPN